MAIIKAIAARIMTMLKRPFNAYRNIPMPQTINKIMARMNRKLLMVVFLY